MQGSSVTVVTVGLMFHYRGNNFPAEAVFFLNKSAVFSFFFLNLHQFLHQNNGVTNCSKLG